MDGNSYTGLVISLGTDTNFVKSGEKKCVTKSSCEATIIALSEVFFDGCTGLVIPRVLIFLD